MQSHQFNNILQEQTVMESGRQARISLRTKFIIFIGAIISAFYLFVLYRTAQFDESIILRQAEQQARMLYKQIQLTRQWASDHNGLFILKAQGVEANPYLKLPSVKDSTGQTYFLRNPAMITRELSQYARRDGLGQFRVTSLHPVNPANTPDTFEKKALAMFEKGEPEIVAVEDTPAGRFVRFMAPLYIKQSCLGCHARHGYKEGDIRGGLSITIPINWVDKLIERNIHSLIFLGVASIVLVTIFLFLMFDNLVFRRIYRLSSAMEAFPEEGPEEHLLPSVFRDELDVVNDSFVSFCDRLNRSQEELLRTKAQAHFSEKMASLGILSAGIAHEVNNPLGGMLNCVKSLRENPEDIELHKRYLPLLDKGMRQIEQVMRQLLNFGRSEPLAPRLVDLRRLMEECAVLLSYKLKNIELVTSFDLDGEYLLDAEALKQIVINIGLNAIQAMKDGGRLEIAMCEDGTDLLLTFEDSGCGISEEHLAHIFDPFFTTKEVGEGTGLGLAVTYSLIQRMNGTITVDSSVGIGTIFTVTLPIGGGDPDPRKNTTGANNL